MVRKILIAAILIITPSTLLAGSFTATANALYFRFNDSRYSYADEYQIVKQPQIFTKSISLGYSFSPIKSSPIQINLASNRLTNWQIKRKLKDNQTGILFDYRTKTIVDSLNVGYRKGRLMPNLIFGNIDLRKKLYYRDRLLATDRERFFVAGVGLNYFLNANVAVGLSYYAPIKAIHSEGAVGASAALFF